MFGNRVSTRGWTTVAFVAVSGATMLSVCTSVASGQHGTPRLPSKPFRYASDTYPRGVDHETLKRLDNTPLDNPITDAGAALGRVLFYDKQLSANNSISCSSCHRQENGFSDPRRFSVGFKGGHTSRNSMSLANLRFTHISDSDPGFFWDERAQTLEEQALMPIQDQVEMGMELPKLEVKLRGIDYYPPLFHAAFGSPKITHQRVARALAQFVRSMVSFDSKFDRAAAAVENDYSKDFPDFTATENLGKSLFINGLNGVAEIGCAHCHVPPSFAMPKSFNNGLDLTSADKGLGGRDVPLNDPFSPSNDGKFRASPLRNIELSAPYMHDGRFKSLEQVIGHYSSGVHPHPNLGLAIDEQSIDATQVKSGFGYTAKQQAALVAFLKTLTDKWFVADPKFSNPFTPSDK